MRACVYLFAATIVSAGPVSAQFYSSPLHAPRPTTAPIVGSTSPTIGREVGAVFKDIHDGVHEGQLSHSQARELRREADEIGHLEELYATDGLSDSEIAELQNRIEVLRSITDAKRSGTVK